MAERVEIHKRQFSDYLQEQIKSECESKMIVWHGFEDVALIQREVGMGTQTAKTLLPLSLHEHVRYEVNPFNYSVSFYLSIGYECGTCNSEIG